MGGLHSSLGPPHACPGPCLGWEGPRDTARATGPGAVLALGASSVQCLGLQTSQLEMGRGTAELCFSAGSHPFWAL